MQKVIFYFLYAQCLDVLTTIVGLNMGAQEINPLVDKLGFGGLVLLKLAIVFGYVILLSKLKLKFKFHRFFMIVPWIAVFPAVWNCVILITMWA